MADETQWVNRAKDLFDRVTEKTYKLYKIMGNINTFKDYLP
jgi:hypothetical protein